MSRLGRAGMPGADIRGPVVGRVRHSSGDVLPGRRRRALAGHDDFEQIIYRIKAADDSGLVRRGSVRLGSAATGVLSDDVSVEWDP
jgi:hypothetical protein